MNALGGCKLVQTTANIPGEAVRAVSFKNGEEQVQTDPVILQQDIFRFCDEYTNTISLEIDKLTQSRKDFSASGIAQVKTKSKLSTPRNRRRTERLRQPLRSGLSGGHQPSYV
ncbi:MAG: hypothetical protein QM760_15210 [Nibricoccus sp.]